MVIKPFPRRMRIGTDVVHIPTIRDLLQSKPTVFPQKFLTPREWSYYRARFEPLFRAGREDLDVLATFLAGRWAAKEAVIKANSPFRLYLRNVEIWQGAGNEMMGLVLPESTYRPDDYQENIHPPDVSDVDPSNEQHLNETFGSRFDGHVESVSISHHVTTAVATALSYYGKAPTWEVGAKREAQIKTPQIIKHPSDDPRPLARAMREAHNANWRASTAHRTGSFRKVSQKSRKSSFPTSSSA